MKNKIIILFLFVSQVTFSQSALHTSIAGYWDFDESSGSLIDQVGSNDGTPSGVSYSSTGKINSAYDFSSGDIVTLPDNATMSFYAENLTFAAWVYITAAPSSGTEYAIVGGEDYSAGLAINEHRKLIFTLAAYDSASDASTGKVALSTWTHVAVTFNYTTNAVSYYLNGAASGTATMAGDVTSGSSSNKLGDSYWAPDYFVGRMDEVGYWSTVLTAALIDTLYNGPDGSGGEGYSYPFVSGCPAFDGGTVGSDQNFPAGGGDVAAFTSSESASGGTGTITYQWRYSTTSSTPGSGTWTNIPGSNSTTYNYGNVITTTYFVRYASAATCGTGYSNVITVTVAGAGSPTALSPVFRLRFEGNGADASGNEFAGHHTGTDSSFVTDKIEGTYSYNAGHVTGSYFSNWESKGTYTFADREFTVAFNFKAVSRYGGKSVIFTNKMNSGQPGISIGFDEDNRSLYGRSTDAAYAHNELATANSIISWDTWYHIVAVFRSGSVTVFLNNTKLTLPDSVISTTWGNLTDTLAIASYTDESGEWFANGWFDNFHLYDYDISTAQVDSLYTFRASSTFQLGGGGSPPSGYYPPSGALVPYVDGVRKYPFPDGLVKYMYKGGITAPPSTDTIEYILFDNFESWTNASVQSYDSLIERIPMSGYYMPAQQEIINFGGEHQKVWQSTMLNGGATSMEFYMPLGDTFSDIYFDYDLYVEEDFNNIGIGGIASHKFPGGFEGGDDLDLNSGNPAYGRSGVDSINLLGGRGGWSGLVSGNSNDMLMIYPYNQPKYPSTNWYGSPSGDSGYFQLPYGYWLHITIHHRVNDPGQSNGFTEVYLDGLLRMRHNSLKWRSVQQGEDYGKVEQLRMEYFFGSGTGDERNSVGNNTIWMDNWVVYKYKPGAIKHGASPGTKGVTTTPVVEPPPAGRYMPADNQLDEIYTAVADTIFDTGNNSPLYWPAFKKEEITKEVTLPSGTINYAFVSAQWGWNWPDECTYVKVYKGIGAGKTLEATWGRTDCGYTDPGTITRTINDNEATFVIYPGSAYGYTKGISIRYWQP